jgi:hypothetical protein
MPMSQGSDVGTLKAKLKKEMDAIHKGPSRISSTTQFRMIPSTKAKEKRKPFVDSSSM